MNRCKAKQYSDQMVCDHCGICWDMNDDDLPECKVDDPPKKNLKSNGIKRRVNKMKGIIDGRCASCHRCRRDRHLYSCLGCPFEINRALQSSFDKTAMIVVFCLFFAIFITAINL